MRSGHAAPAFTQHHRLLLCTDVQSLSPLNVPYEHVHDGGSGGDGAGDGGRGRGLVVVGGGDGVAVVCGSALDLHQWAQTNQIHDRQKGHWAHGLNTFVFCSPRARRRTTQYRHVTAPRAARMPPDIMGGGGGGARAGEEIAEPTCTACGCSTSCWSRPVGTCPRNLTSSVPRTTVLYRRCRPYTRSGRRTPWPAQQLASAAVVVVVVVAAWWSAACSRAPDIAPTRRRCKHAVRTLDAAEETRKDKGLYTRAAELLPGRGGSARLLSAVTHAKHLQAAQNPVCQYWMSCVAWHPPVPYAAGSLLPDGEHAWPGGQTQKLLPPCCCKSAPVQAQLAAAGGGGVGRGVGAGGSGVLGLGLDQHRSHRVNTTHTESTTGKRGIGHTG